MLSSIANHYSDSSRQIHMGRVDKVVMKEKRRLLKSNTYASSLRTVTRDTAGNIVRDSTVQDTRSYYAWQITLSEGHRWPTGRSVRDVGGPFETVRTMYNTSHENNSFAANVKSGLFTYDFSGAVILNAPLWSIAEMQVPEPTLQQLTSAAAPTFPQGTDMQSKGTTLVSRAIPTNPMVDSSVGLAELFREGIPKMIGSSLLRDRVGFLRGLGSEYLNYEFGWKPLVNDVKAAAKAVIESETIIKQLVRDSGKNVHRRRNFLPIQENVVSYATAPAGPGASNISAFWNPSRISVTDFRRRDTWFSGCFTFEYDPGNLSQISNIVTQARLVYGLQLNPEVLWNLAPWSWLVDWFVNVGPLLHNVSAFQNDQLVMRYGYVMDRHRRRLVTIGKCSHKSTNTLPELYTEVLSLDWKRRQQASPYGFGIASSSFTIRQWAILAALGITRGPAVP